MMSLVLAGTIGYKLGMLKIVRKGEGSSVISWTTLSRKSHLICTKWSDEEYI